DRSRAQRHHHRHQANDDPHADYRHRDHYSLACRAGCLL
ncbi:MAG: hypothetical protein AVDCRST_MAG87-1350, partial [uncultured Thermomicrobiales bacterium]